MTNLVLTARIEDGISAGALAASAALDKLGATAEVTETRVTRMSKTATQLAGRYDAVTQSAKALTRAEAELAAARDSLQRGVENGSITIEQQGRTLDALTARVAAARQAQAQLYGTVTSGAGAASYAVRGLGMQSIDVFQQLATGAPVFTTLVQQGSQVAQATVAAGVGFGQLARGAAGAILSVNPFLAAAGAATAVLTYFATTAESADRRLAALRNTLAATRADYVTMGDAAAAAAKVIAATTGVSTEDARAATTAFAGQRSFAGGQAQLESLVRTTADLAARIGVSLPEAVALVAPAMRDAGNLAKELEGRLLGFDAELTRSIELQVRSGDTAGAFERVMGRVRESTRGAADAIKTDLQQSLDALAQQFTTTSSDGSSFGSQLTSLVARYVDYIGFLVRTTKSAADAIGGISVGGARPVDPRVTNNADAVGVFGMRRAAAADVGMSPEDRFDYARNVRGGVQYFRQQYEAFGGSLDDATRGYNQGTRGAQGGLGGDYLARVQNRDTATLAAGVADDIERAYWVVFADYARTSAGPSILRRLKQIALQESSGNHFAGATPSEVVTVTPPPPVDVTASGTTNVASILVDNALARADRSGVSGATRDTARADVAAYTAALGALAAAGETSGDRVSRLREALVAAGKAVSDAIPPAARLSREIEDQAVAAAGLAAAYDRGYDAVARVTAGNQAQAAANTVTARGTAENVAVTAALTEKYVALADAVASVGIKRSIAENRDAIRLIEAETASLGENADARALLIAGVKAEIELKKAGKDAESELGQEYLASTAALTSATQQLDRHKAALDAVVSAVTSAADSIANAITQSFLSGSGAAVNWANIAKAAITQVTSEVLKLSVINPALNSVLGTARPTLGALSSGSSGTGVSTATGLLSGGGSGGGANIFSLSSGIDGWGARTFPGIFDATSTGGLGAFGSLSNILGIAGAAIPGLLSGNYAQAGLGTAGAAAGLGIGSAIGGTILGIGAGPIGLIAGGLLGNALGGLIGPKPKNAYSSTGVTLTGGRLALGRTVSQIVDTEQEVATATAQVAQINQFLDNVGVTISSLGRLSQIGQNTPGGTRDPSKFSDINSAFSEFRFSSPGNAPLDRALSGRGFSSLSDLQSTIDGVKTFVDQTVPALKALGSPETSYGIGTFATSIKTLTDTFDAAIATAHTLGYAEEDLAAARASAVAAANAAQAERLRQIDASLQGRFLTAQASVLGTPEAATAAALYNFDTQADIERKQFSKQLLETYGDAYKASADYADQVARLERTLGAERLAVVRQYADQSKQIAAQQQVQQREQASARAANVIGGVAAYATSLQVGALSPMSAAEQYEAARGRFSAVRARASTGDVTSISDLQGAAETFLGASRTLNDNGAGYARDFSTVIAALAEVSRVSPDTLTASTFTLETRTGFATIAEALADLRAAVERLNQSQGLASIMPARVL